MRTRSDPTPPARASLAFVTRFSTTCRIWVVSPSTGVRGARSSSRRLCSEIDARSRSAISSTRWERSSGLNVTPDLPEYASICSVSPAPCSAAARIRASRRVQRRIGRRRPSPAIRLLPRITASRLLKSCAMPPVSMARLSSRSASCTCSSSLRRSSSACFASVTSRAAPTTQEGRIHRVGGSRSDARRSRRPARISLTRRTSSSWARFRRGSPRTVAGADRDRPGGRAGATRRPSTRRACSR